MEKEQIFGLVRHALTIVGGALVAKGLFIAMLAGLGIKAGIGAMQALRGANVATATIGAVKAALKGRDIAVVGAEIAGAVAATA